MSNEQRDQLRFRVPMSATRSRPVPQRAAKSRFAWGWVVFAIIGMFITFGLIRSLLERTAGTAGYGEATATGVNHQEVPMAEVSQMADPDPGTVAIPAPEPPVVASAPERFIHECKGRDGSVTFQSHPCGPGQTAGRDIRVVESAAPFYRPQQAQHAEAELATIRQSQPQGAAVYTATYPAPGSACENARNERAATLERVGFNKTYDLMSSLDEMVRKACK